MALCFCDGFDSYAATADLVKKWALAQSPWTWNATGAPDGGPYVSCASAANIHLRTGSIMSTTRPQFGFYFRMSGIVAGMDWFSVYDVANNLIMRLRINAAGNMNFLNSDGGVNATFTLKNIADNQWHWLELDLNTVNGQTQRIFIDNVQEGAVALNMFSALVNRMFIISLNGAALSLANMVIWDNNGSGLTVASTPIGPRSIDTLRPNGDAAVQFARSTGSTNFSLVDEVNGDVSDYVESGTSGQQDLYDYAALGFTPNVINSVMVNSYMHNPSVGGISGQAVCKSGATTLLGTSAAMAFAPRVMQQPFDLDPNGNIPWTQANLDAAQFGLKVA